MTARLGVGSVQKQAVAAWVHALSQIRVDTLLSALAEQARNLELALASIAESKSTIDVEILHKNLGGTKEMHGFIAEVAEIGVGKLLSCSGDDPSLTQSKQVHAFFGKTSLTLEALEPSHLAYSEVQQGTYAATLEAEQTALHATSREQRGLLSRAFAPDLATALIGSVELAGSLGVPADEILDTPEKTAAFFLDEAATPDRYGWDRARVSVAPPHPRRPAHG